LALAPQTAFVLAVLYAAATLVEAIRVGRREGLRVVLLVWAVFPTMHAAHGTGFGVGLARYSFRPDW
jgi:hypothetical protein